jgi:type I restriction enzyme S subunit
VSLSDGKKFRRRCNPELGDILLVSRGATIGRVAKVNSNKEFCLLGSVILIKPNEKISNEFLLVSLQNKLLQDNFLFTSHHSAQQAIYLVNVSEVYLAIPPKSDQVKISEYIKTASRQIETAISCKQNEIEKLKEYKAVLINSAVTGKIKVCGNSQNAEVKSNYAKSNE